MSTDITGFPSSLARLGVDEFELGVSVRMFRPHLQILLIDLLAVIHVLKQRTDGDMANFEVVAGGQCVSDFAQRLRGP